MTATIIIIGNEILLGRVVDTNSGLIARHLDPLGIAVERVVTVGDSEEAISSAVRSALASSPLVLTTGGLGPTKDDITKKVLLDVFGGEMVFDESVYANVCEQFRRRGLPMNRLTRGQALVPSSARVIQNEAGTAPIMWFDNGSSVLVSLPGVPSETAAMLPRAVIPAVARRFSPGTAMAHATFVTSGLSESALAERLEPWENALPEGFRLAYLPDSPVIKLRLDGTGPDEDRLRSDMDALAASLRALIADVLIADSDIPLAQMVLQTLDRRGWTLATAESCTGGNIAHAVTLIPGSSSCFRGAVVAYANEVKQRALGVDGAVLEEHGAVSSDTVAQMLDGACRLMCTDCAVATSGIAGPGGAVPGKPVGTVWIGVRTPLATDISLHRFPGPRSRVIERATATALIALLKSITATS